MARLTHEPITPRRSVSNPDSLTDLNRLLARLQHSILQADAERERRLRTSEYERNKVSINLEYARTLLTKLEHDALGIKVHTRRQETQTDLNRKREVLERLSERLRELEELAIDSDDDDDEDNSEEGEDLLGDSIVVTGTPSRSEDSRKPTDHHRQKGIGIGEEEENGDADADESTILAESRRVTRGDAHSPLPQQQTTSPARATSQGSGTTTSQTIRSRGGGVGGSGSGDTQQQQPTATTTATSTSSAAAEANAQRSKLFGDQTATTDLSTTSATAEAIMDHHRAEQDKLTESMVGMARALKESTYKFSSSLQEDEEVLKAAGSGLDKNERGLEGVSGRMGSLRKLTEGEGWWGRMLLYAWIFGLAVGAVLLVFVLPKLRF